MTFGEQLRRQARRILDPLTALYASDDELVAVAAGYNGWTDQSATPRQKEAYDLGRELREQSAMPGLPAGF